MVSPAFRTIFALSEPAAVQARRDEVADTLEARFPKAAVSMRDAKIDVLAFAQFPIARWRTGALADWRTGAKSGRTTRSNA